MVAFLLLGSGWQEEVIEMIVIANLWNKRYNSDSDGNRDSRLQDRVSLRERKHAALISIVCVVPQISNRDMINWRKLRCRKKENRKKEIEKY